MTSLNSRAPTRENEGRWLYALMEDEDIWLVGEGVRAPLRGKSCVLNLGGPGLEMARARGEGESVTDDMEEAGGNVSSGYKVCSYPIGLTVITVWLVEEGTRGCFLIFVFCSRKGFIKPLSLALPIPPSTHNDDEHVEEVKNDHGN